MNKTLTQLAQQYMNEYEKQKKVLGLKKYGNTYNPYLDWNRQVGQIQPNWTQLDEENAKLELQALENYRLNTQTLQSQAQQLYESATRDKAQLGIDNQLVQKYLGNNLRALGQSTSGVAESTMAQQGNTYLSNLANINRDTRQLAQNLYNAYSNQRLADEQSLGERQSAIKESYDSMLSEQMMSELDAIVGQGNLTKERYDIIKQNYINQGLSQQAINSLDDTYGKYIERQGITQDTPAVDIYTIDTADPQNLKNFLGTGGDNLGEYYLYYKRVNNLLTEIKSNAKKYENKIFRLGKNKYKYIDGYFYKIDKGTIDYSLNDFD
jgi:hypothetical protein